jgi:hypothetical protein
LINGEAIEENKFLPTNENNITTPIFTKLLATSNVANNFFGVSNKIKIKFPFETSSFETVSKSFEDSEKKATSAPESKAEINSNAKIPIKPISILVSID